MTPEDSQPRILFVTRYEPFPATSGDLMYSGQIISLLGDLTGQLTVICAQRESAKGGRSSLPGPNGAKISSKLQARANLARYFLGISPKAALDFDLPENGRTLFGFLTKYEPDVVVIDHIGSTWALRPFLSYKRIAARAPKLMYVTHNEELSTRLSIARNASFPFGLPHFLDAIKIFFRDRAMLRASDLLSCITKSDETLYATRADTPAIVVSPVYDRHIIARREITPDTPRKVIVVSNFLWSAKLINLKGFLTHSAPTLLSHGISVEVVGRMSPKNLIRFRKRFPGVQIHGEVEKVEPFLADARIGLLIDQAGGGLKLTTLSYVFNKIPVVALSNAVTDKNLRNHCMIAQDLDDLARLVISLIDDFERLNAIKERAFEGLKDFLDTSANRRTLECALNNLMRNASAPSNGG
ncbi:MAG TPA: glycosyltransferase [Rhizomicrobium sp.]|nr:glycosyltransferase [Rhizomicrobium sp.]